MEGGITTYANCVPRAGVREVTGAVAEGAQGEEEALDTHILEVEAAVHEALCANVNTAGALQALSTLMSRVNVYLSARPRPQGGPGGARPPLAVLCWRQDWRP